MGNVTWNYGTDRWILHCAQKKTKKERKEKAHNWRKLAHENVLSIKKFRGCLRATTFSTQRKAILKVREGAFRHAENRRPSYQEYIELLGTH
jgi:hypothetical protein